MKLGSLYRRGLEIRRKLDHPFCTAIIVAAGSASRMNGVDKILTKLDGMPVICRTLEAFDHNVLVDEIVVVARRETMEQVAELCAQYPKVRVVVPGGATRAESVLAGLAAASEQTQFVAVHDGARPLVSDDIVTKTIAKAEKFSAAAPAIAVKDTIAVTQNGEATHTPSRDTLRAVQTPQVFDRDLLEAALENAKQKELTLTDDCSAVEALGMKIQLTDGDEENIKITTPMDLELAELILKRRREA